MFLPHVLVKVDMECSKTGTFLICDDCAHMYSIIAGAKTRYHTPEVSSVAVPEKPKQEDTTLLCKKLFSTPRGLVSDMDDDTIHQDGTNSDPRQEDMIGKSQVMQPLDLNVVRKTQPTQGLPLSF